MRSSHPPVHSPRPTQPPLSPPYSRMQPGCTMTHPTQPGAPVVGPPSARTIRKDDGSPRKKKTALWKRHGTSHPGHMTADHIAVGQCKRYMSDVAATTDPFGLGAPDFWQRRGEGYPILKDMRHLFDGICSTAENGRVFSLTCHILTSHRNRLSPGMVKSLATLKYAQKATGR